MHFSLHPFDSDGSEFDSRPFHCCVATCDKFFTHNVPLSPSSIIWYQSCRAAMYCGWEGNRRSGVALAMRHVVYSPVGLLKAQVREVSTPPALFVVCYGVWCSH